MNKIIFSILFLVFLFAATASENFACSCELQKEISIEKQVRQAYVNSSAVFVGEVVEVIIKPDVYSVKVRFKIEKSWNKNNLKEIIISTGKGGGDCGYEFVVGKRYLVYAYGDDKLNTNICTRTDLAEENKDIAVLNKIKKPKLKSAPK